MNGYGYLGAAYLAAALLYGGYLLVLRRSERAANLPPRRAASGTGDGRLR